MASHRLLRRTPHSAVGVVGRRAFNAMAAYRIDVRPNGKEAPGTIDDWSGRPAMPGDG